MNTRDVTLHLDCGKLKFSAGHFIIFSDTRRETLHGHNYTLQVALTASLCAPGITLDYRIFEEKLIQYCEQLHLRFLIPTHSPYLKIAEDDQNYEIIFNHESMWLLKKDVILLPIENISLEALSQWFVDQCAQDQAFLSQYHIKKIVIRVLNGPNHGAEAQWVAKSYQTQH